MLADPPALEQVLFGPDGVAARSRRRRRSSTCPPSVPPRSAPRRRVDGRSRSWTLRCLGASPTPKRGRSRSRGRRAGGPGSMREVLEALGTVRHVGPLGRGRDGQARQQRRRTCRPWCAWARSSPHRPGRPRARGRARRARPGTARLVRRPVPRQGDRPGASVSTSGWRSRARISRSRSRREARQGVRLTLPTAAVARCDEAIGKAGRGGGPRTTLVGSIPDIRSRAGLDDRVRCPAESTTWTP